MTVLSLSPNSRLRDDGRQHINPSSLAEVIILVVGSIFQQQAKNLALVLLAHHGLTTSPDNLHRYGMAFQELSSSSLRSVLAIVILVAIRTFVVFFLSSSAVNNTNRSRVLIGDLAFHLKFHFWVGTTAALFPYIPKGIIRCLPFALTLIQPSLRIEQHELWFRLTGKLR